METLRHGEKQSLEDFIATENHIVMDARFTLIEMLLGARHADRKPEETHTCMKVVSGLYAVSQKGRNMRLV